MNVGKGLLGILLTVLTISTVSCKKDVPDFPTKHIFEQLPGESSCVSYEIIQDNPLTVSEGKDLPKEQCPLSVIGFDVEDSGAVFNWIREVQRKLEQKIQSLEAENRDLKYQLQTLEAQLQ